ncbi:MAG TPA: caspase family protein [Solirubrobacteraceae bacterium]|nr:caspase family protein [Solirubrobacteraceae bacterium]
MSEKGSRHALIVAVSNYRETKLRRLRAPAADATALARALGNPAIGDFDVVVSSDETEGTLRRRIATFFADRMPEDLLLLHFSCHGIKNGRELYLAATDTELGLLTATGIPSSWLSEQMTDCRSKSIVLLLDCCFSGSFPFGMRRRAGGAVDVEGHLDGRGRAIITASSELEYAYEGDELSGSAVPSIFTRTIVEGLETGEADRDGDKWISVDDLYDYVYDRVKVLTNAQTPRKMSTLEGSLRIARSVYQPPITAADLEPDLVALTKNTIPSARASAVAELAKRLHTGAPGQSFAARQRLEAMADDDSRMVAQAAAAALATIDRAPAESGAPSGGRTLAVSRGVLIACVGAIGVAGALALIVFGGSSQAHAARYTAGDLTVSARSRWRRAPSESRTFMTDTLSLSDGGTRVTIGTLPRSERAAAVPSVLLHTLGDPSKSTVTSTNAGPARRYLWSSGFVLYVIATSAGELAAGCNASPSRQPVARTLADCGEIASTAAVHGASVEFPGVPAGLAARIDAALATRSASAAELRPRLDASSLHARKSALLRLVEIDDQGAAAIAAIVASARYSAATHTLRVALQSEAHDGRTAALDELPLSRGPFDARRAAFDRASDRLVSAVHAVGELGIAVPNLEAIELPPVPAPEQRRTQHTSTPIEPAATPSPETHAPETRSNERREPEKEQRSSGSA